MRTSERELRDRNKFKGNRSKEIQSGRRTANKESTLDPGLFVKKAILATDVTYSPSRQIRELPIDSRLKLNLTKKGYSHPTEIQDRTLEGILTGKDLLGIAQTGTGKTGAFLIPLVNGLLGSKPAFQVLVVVPTRELAVQVEQEFRSITKDLGLSSACFIGGTSVSADLRALRRSYHIVIGTPGRLIDLADQKALNFRHFTGLVLDEFDRLLDMGFSRDIQRIIRSMTSRKQTLLFSATEERSQQQLISEILQKPIEVRISLGNVTGELIDQEIIRVKEGENKLQVLLGMVQHESFQKVLVFADTKRWVKRVCQQLQKAGIKADEIHGNKSQNYRLKALDNFKTGKTRVLIATDVAARGLDITEVTHVINYQQPKNFDSYIHRIGRTGRAGKTGKAYTFVN
jgi:ATP-dependent RNA helicase RhlE